MLQIPKVPHDNRVTPDVSGISAVARTRPLYGEHAVGMRKRRRSPGSPIAWMEWFRHTLQGPIWSTIVDEVHALNWENVRVLGVGPS